MIIDGHKVTLSQEPVVQSVAVDDDYELHQVKCDELGYQYQIPCTSDRVPIGPTNAMPITTDTALDVNVAGTVPVSVADPVDTNVLNAVDVNVQGTVPISSASPLDVNVAGTVPVSVADPVDTNVLNAVDVNVQGTVPISSATDLDVNVTNTVPVSATNLDTRALTSSDVVTVTQSTPASLQATVTPAAAAQFSTLPPTISLNTYVNASVTNTGAVISGAAAKVHGYSISVNVSPVILVALYDQSGAPGTGDSANIKTYLAANGQDPSQVVWFPPGKELIFLSGIGVRGCTGHDLASGGSISANDVGVVVYWTAL